MGLGAPCRDVLLEVWQANAAGRYNHPADQQTDEPFDSRLPRVGSHRYRSSAAAYINSRTIKPGPVIGRRGYKPMAPHVNIWLVARGINIGLSTRMYFEDEAARNEQDPVLRMIEPRSAADLAGSAGEWGRRHRLCFDLHLQGESGNGLL